MIKAEELNNLRRRVSQYRDALHNTQQYRKVWGESLRQFIADTLTEIMQSIAMTGEIEFRDEIDNLEAVAFTLGSEESGLGEPVGSGLKRDLIKHNGALVYQQLFNGKILVLINYPYIEKYGQPQPPKTIAIYRPEEIKSHYIIRHVETFVTELTQWEDYDDDQPEPNQRIGFKLNFQDDAGQSGL